MSWIEYRFANCQDVGSISTDGYICVLLSV